MKPTHLLIALCFGVAFAHAAETSFNFDAAKPGSPPSDWLATQTGDGSAKWTVERDSTAPSAPQVLKQSGNADFPVCLATNVSFADGTLEMKFKPVKGEDDQAAGMVWRAKDARNYYVVRANALEGNVRIYKFVDGKRTQFGGVKKEVAANRWHTLKLEATGVTFKVWLNGEELFTAEDKTFAEPGAAGLWTKADSGTLFDDFEVLSR
jgi:hypothetical protein